MCVCLCVLQVVGEYAYLCEDIDVKDILVKITSLLNRTYDGVCGCVCLSVLSCLSVCLSICLCVCVCETQTQAQTDKTSLSFVFHEIVGISRGQTVLLL